jgi:hypothetical protein
MIIIFVSFYFIIIIIIIITINPYLLLPESGFTSVFTPSIARIADDP